MQITKWMEISCIWMLIRCWRIQLGCSSCYFLAETKSFGMPQNEELPVNWWHLPQGSRGLFTPALICNSRNSFIFLSQQCWFFSFTARKTYEQTDCLAPGCSGEKSVHIYGWWDGWNWLLFQDFPVAFCLTWTNSWVYRNNINLY